MDVVTGKTCSARRGGRRAFCALTAAALLLVLPAGAVETRPAATAPATQPKFPPMVQARTAAKALKYDAAEDTILAVVEDRGDYDVPALYVLLRRAEMLPEGREVLDQADRPNLRNLWEKPRPYRGQLIRVTGRYAGRVTDLTETANRTHRWPYPRPVWAMDIIVEFGRNVPPERMVVVMGRPPPRGLAKNQPLEFAGIFLKRASLPEDPKRGDPKVRNYYPVIVARRAYAVAAPGGGVPVMLYVMFGLVAAMLIAFILLKRKIGAAGRRAGGYTPLRFEDARRDAEDSEAAAEQVDEDLRREVERYLAERNKLVEEENDKDTEDPR